MKKIYLIIFIAFFYGCNDTEPEYPIPYQGKMSFEKKDTIPVRVTPKFPKR